MQVGMSHTVTSISNIVCMQVDLIRYAGKPDAFVCPYCTKMIRSDTSWSTKNSFLGHVAYKHALIYAKGHWFEHSH